MRMTLNSRVRHHAYGEGVILNFETRYKPTHTIVLVKWDNPDLSCWPGEEPVSEFWTDPEDLDVILPVDSL
jgi:hypothetical protein